MPEIVVNTNVDTPAMLVLTGVFLQRIALLRARETGSNAPIEQLLEVCEGDVPAGTFTAGATDNPQTNKVVDEAVRAGGVDPTTGGQNAPTATGQDGSTVNPTSGGAAVERDRNGYVHDVRIHARTRSKNDDGTWKYMRGVAKTLVAKVEAELRANEAKAAAETPKVPDAPAASTDVPPPPSSSAEVPPPPAETFQQHDAGAAAGPQSSADANRELVPPPPSDGAAAAGVPSPPVDGARSADVPPPPPADGAGSNAGGVVEKSASGADDAHLEAYRALINMVSAAVAQKKITGAQASEAAKLVGASGLQALMGQPHLIPKVTERVTMLIQAAELGAV